jgi:hypothetical protein
MFLLYLPHLKQFMPCLGGFRTPLEGVSLVKSGEPNMVKSGAVSLMKSESASLV